MLPINPATERAPQPVTPHSGVTPTSAEPAVPHKLRVRGLHAWFGRTEVLKGVTLDLPERTTTAVIGPSGCGKSTFVRCLNRLHELTPGAKVEGSVLLDGRDIYERSSDPVLVRRRVGMVFQKPNPFPTLSIRDNVLAGVKLSRGSAFPENEVLEKVLRQVGLWDEVKHRLHLAGTSLSGGQQQRLCIARTLALAPEVLLMDEPCSALDPVATSVIEELIRELGHDYTVVLVTHNMQQAARVAEYTAFFYLGELVEFGKTDLIFTKPKQARTEDYLTGRFG